jgi:hypothetical protein
MPTPSGRPTAEEKRLARAQKQRAAENLLGDAWDAENGGVGAALAAAIKAEADANPGSRIKREFTGTRPYWLAVRSALDKVVGYPAYVFWTSESFMLFGGGPHPFTIELTRQTDAEVAEFWARARALMQDAIADVKAERASA